LKKTGIIGRARRLADKPLALVHGGVCSSKPLSSFAVLSNSSKSYFAPMIGYPAFFQASKPPPRATEFLYPNCRYCAARPADVASCGQPQ